MARDEDEDEAWEWVHTPPCLHDSVASAADQEEDDQKFFLREDDAVAGPSAGFLTKNVMQISESLSSTASSPILKHSVAVTVIAKEKLSALDAMHDAACEWIEPQLVFLNKGGLHFEGYEAYEVVTHLQNLPKAKEALISLLSDPEVCNAVIRNKAFQQLTCNEKGTSLYKQGGKTTYKSLKQKLKTVVDIVMSLLGSHTLERNVVDELDATVKSCILLVAVLVFVVLSKRSNEGLFVERTLV